jgi:hypothetical protein
MPEPSDLERVIDEVCDRFEARWRAGERPVVEDYLGAVPKAARGELLRELLRLEIDYRRRRGEQPALEDYLPRWPEPDAMLLELLGEVLPAPRPAPAPARPLVELELTASYQGPPTGAAVAIKAPSDERLTRVLPPPPAAPATLPEQLGRYKVLRLLRRDGTGTVYLAEDAQPDRLVAIKVPNLGPGSPPMTVERFRRSARAAARLAHRNLCPIYEVGEAQGVPFLVMPHLAMPSLADRLQEGGPFAPREAAEVVRKLATAMQAAHQAGVIHRDLNPASILLGPGGEPIVVDFGLVRSVEGEAFRLTQTGEVLGIPAYSAPEQLSGSPEAQGPGCDVFSLGAVLYELLTGQAPFGRTLQEVLLQIMTRESAPPSALRPEIESELDRVCLKALACKVQERFRSMGELAEALGRLTGCQEGQPTGGRPGKRVLLLVVLALLAGIVLGGAGYQILFDREKAGTDGLPAGAAAPAPPPGRGGDGEKARANGLPIGKAEVRPEAAPGGKVSRVPPLDGAALEALTARRGKDQLDALAAVLKERNALFDGKFFHSRLGPDGVVLELGVSTDNVADLSGVRALTGLELLMCTGSSGKGQLTDLTPLQGMEALRRLVCNLNPRLSDLAPLKGLKLRALHCYGTAVSDLSPLKDMGSLDLLECAVTPLSDLTPLKGLTLTNLQIHSTNVTDLSPLKGMKLRHLLLCPGHVKDLSPLQGMPLKEITCPFEAERDAPILRSLTTLERINGKTAKEFLAKVDSKKS